jgi:uncharacterized OB-fold protein
MAEIIERAFPVDPSQLLPAITPDNEAFWNGLAQGYLQLQACDGCGKVRNPIAPVCPYCQSNEWQWKRLSGRGTIFSFVRFHRSYLPEFEDLMPYFVATVELEEGARMFGRLSGSDLDPRIGQAVNLIIERWPDGRCVAAFELDK